MITSFDDYCIHQTHEPIAQPSQSDRNFYDRYWFNGINMDDGFMFEVGFGLYPNRWIMDGHFSVSIGGMQHSFHGSRRAPKERADTSVGPLRVEVVTPMRQIRVHLAPNETGIECDLLFTARTAPTEEPKNIMYDNDRLIMHNSRFTQLGYWSGYFSVNGVRQEVSGAVTRGTRDKSWGVRPVGETEAGAPSILNTEPGVYWTWSPVDFGDVCTQFGTFEDHDGNPTQVSGCMVPTYNNPEEIPQKESGHIEMDRATHKIQWESGTRRPVSAQMELVEKNGTTHAISLIPVMRFLMLGVGYNHPEWGHAHWRGEEEIGAESWRLDDLDMLDYKHIHIHQAVKATMGDREGIGTLETIVFGRHDPSGFKDILDGAP
jgi:hypothetical protein